MNKHPVYAMFPDKTVKELKVFPEPNQCRELGAGTVLYDLNDQNFQWWKVSSNSKYDSGNIEIIKDKEVPDWCKAWALLL